MVKRIIALFAFALMAVGPTLALAQTEIRWGTSRVGSSGHRAITNLVQVIQDKVPNYRFTVQPTPGAILTVKGYSNGDFEGYYGADIAFYEFANDINRFKGFSAQAKRKPLQSFWTFTVESGVAVHVRDKDKIKSWSDLSGQRVFTGPRPWDTRANLERAFSILGVKHEYMEVDTKTAGSLLEQGRFTGLGIYSNAEATTAPWITETTLQTDWTPVNPTAEEVETLKKGGMNPVVLEPSVFGEKTAGGEKVTLFPFYYGLHLGADVPEDDLYNILKVIEANVGELAKADKGFKQIEADMVGMQVRGVESSIDLVEVHPGLAKYMREKGVWKSEWDSRVAKIN